LYTEALLLNQKRIRERYSRRDDSLAQAAREMKASLVLGIRHQPEERPADEPKKEWAE